MLTITPINFTGIRNLPQAKKLSATTSPLQQDTFQKSISFTGKANFLNWLTSKGLEVADVKKFICDKNILGKGNYNTAFQIPDCDKFCLRVISSDVKQLQEADFSKARLIPFEDPLDINIGQKVATIQVDREVMPIPYNIEILRKQTGESIGVQPPETIVTGDFTSVLREGMLPYEDMTRKEKYARTIHKVAQLPIESYEKLIQDFNKAQKAGYKFDYLNSNNLLVDENAKQINLIDMEKGLPSDLSGLLYALTNAQYYRTFSDTWHNAVSEEMRNQATQDTMQIIRKFMQALKNQDIKLEQNNVPFEAAKDLYSGFPCWLAFRATSASEVWKKMAQLGVAKQ